MKTGSELMHVKQTCQHLSNLSSTRNLAFMDPNRHGGITDVLFRGTSAALENRTEFRNQVPMLCANSPSSTCWARDVKSRMSTTKTVMSRRLYTTTVSPISSEADSDGCGSLLGIWNTNTEWPQSTKTVVQLQRGCDPAAI